MRLVNHIKSLYKIHSDNYYDSDLLLDNLLALAITIELTLCDIQNCEYDIKYDTTLICQLVKSRNISSLKLKLAAQLVEIVENV